MHHQMLFSEIRLSSVKHKHIEFEVPAWCAGGQFHSTLYLVNLSICDFSTSSELSQFGDSRGGVISVADCWRTRIFTLQNGDEYDDYYSESSVSQDRQLQPPIGYYENLITDQVSTARPAKGHKAKARYQLDITHPIGRISRGPDGRFILNEQDYEERYVNLAHGSNSYVESPGVKYRSHSYRNTSAHKRGADGAIVISRHSSDSSDSDQYVQIPVQFDRHGMDNGGLAPPPTTTTTRLVVDSTGAPYHDGVIIRPLLPSLPPHGSRKTEYRRAYVTSSPQAETEGGIIAPFMASDLSSVLPSFSTSGTQSQSQLPPDLSGHGSRSHLRQAARGCLHQPVAYRSKSIPSNIPKLPQRGGLDYEPNQYRRRQSHEPSKTVIHTRPEVHATTSVPHLDNYTPPLPPQPPSSQRAHSMPRPPRNVGHSTESVPPRLVVTPRDDPLYSNVSSEKARKGPGHYLYPGAGLNDPSPWQKYMESRDPQQSWRSRRRRTASSSNESADHPLTYTRDQLERAVDTVRKLSVDTGQSSPGMNQSKESWGRHDPTYQYHGSPPKDGASWRKEATTPSGIPSDYQYYGRRDYNTDDIHTHDDLYSRRPSGRDHWSSSYHHSPTRGYEHESDPFNIYRDPVKPYHPRRSSSFTPRTHSSDSRLSRPPRSDYLPKRVHGSHSDPSDSYMVRGERHSSPRRSSASSMGSSSMTRHKGPQKHRSPPTYLRPSPEGARGLPTSSTDTTSRSSGLGSKETSQSTPSMSGLQTSAAGHRRRGSSPAATGEQRHSSNSSLNRRSMDAYATGPRSAQSSKSASGITHSSQTSGDENYEFDPDATEADLITALKNSSYPDMDPSMLDRLRRQKGSAVEMHTLSKHADVSDSQKRCARLMEEYASHRRNHRDKSHESGYYGDANEVACKQEIESEIL